MALLDSLFVDIEATKKGSEKKMGGKGMRNINGGMNDEMNGGGRMGGGRMEGRNKKSSEDVARDMLREEQEDSDNWDDDDDEDDSFMDDPSNYGSRKVIRGERD